MSNNTILTAEMAQRAIDVSGWFAVSPKDLREAMQSIASGASVAVSAKELSALHEKIAKLESAIRNIKAVVVGERHPNWHQPTAITSARIFIADTCDAAIAQSGEVKK